MSPLFEKPRFDPSQSAKLVITPPPCNPENVRRHGCGNPELGATVAHLLKSGSNVIDVALALQWIGSPRHGAVLGSVIPPKFNPNTLFAQNADRLSPADGCVIVVYSPMITVFDVPSLICLTLTGRFASAPMMHAGPVP